MNKFAARTLRVAFSIGVLVSPSTNAVAVPDQVAAGAASQTATPPSATAQAAVAYSSKSNVGELLDNAEAKAILLKIIPSVVNNPMIDHARSLSLEGLAQFEPALTPQVLAEINIQLAALLNK